MNLQEQVKLRSEQLQQIYDKLNKGVLKDCIEIKDKYIRVKTYGDIVLMLKYDGNFDSWDSVVMKKEIFSRTGRDLSFEEIMNSIVVPTEFELIDEALNKKWTIDWAKQQIVEQFDWLCLTEEGKVTHRDCETDYFVAKNGDVNWEIRHVCNHPIFGLDGESDVYLTEDNYDEYIEFLKEYEEKVLNIKWSWEH